MNSIIKELLNGKAHLGQKNWNRETSSYLLGLRVSTFINDSRISTSKSSENLCLQNSQQKNSLSFSPIVQRKQSSLKKVRISEISPLKLSDAAYDVKPHYAFNTFVEETSSRKYTRLHVPNTTKPPILETKSHSPLRAVQPEVYSLESPHFVPQGFAQLRITTPTSVKRANAFENPIPMGFVKSEVTKLPKGYIESARSEAQNFIVKPKRVVTEITASSLDNPLQVLKNSLKNRDFSNITQFERLKLLLKALPRRSHVEQSSVKPQGVKLLRPEVLLKQRVKGRKRGQVSIFNLEKTALSLSQSLLFIQNVKPVMLAFERKAGSNALTPSKHILLIGGPQIKKFSSFLRPKALLARPLNENGKSQGPNSLFGHTSEATVSLSNEYHLSFLQEKWVGGMLTNWKQVSESLRIYWRFKIKFEKFLEKYMIHFPIYEKYNKRYLGLKEMGTSLPNIIIITNPEENEILIKEAFILKIPIIAFVNSNISISLLNCIQYPIPGNNTSPDFIHFSLNLLLKSSLEFNKVLQNRLR